MQKIEEIAHATRTQKIGFLAFQVKAKYWFTLLRSMEDMTNTDDPIDILGLINAPKPLKVLSSNVFCGSAQNVVTIAV